MFLLSVTDASCLMRYFTRFTDEIFAGLISLIFIYEAVKALVHIFQDLEVKQHHDTALLSLLLALGTFYLAHSLSQIPPQSVPAAEDPRVSGRFRACHRIDVYDAGCPLAPRRVPR